MSSPSYILFIIPVIFVMFKMFKADTISHIILSGPTAVLQIIFFNLNSNVNISGPSIFFVLHTNSLSLILYLSLSRREIIIHCIRFIFRLFSTAYLMNVPLYISCNPLMITYFVFLIISFFWPIWLIYDSHSFSLNFRKPIFLNLYLLSMWNILLNCLLSVSASGVFRLSFILIFLGSFLMFWRYYKSHSVIIFTFLSVTVQHFLVFIIPASIG